MPIKDTHQQYGSVSRFLHWVIALLIISMILLGYLMKYIIKPPLKYKLYSWHKLISLATLVLILVRIIWRVWQSEPKTQPPFSRLMAFAAKMGHFGLYLFMLLLPISGWAMSTAAGYIPHLWGIALPMPGIGKNRHITDIAATIHTVTAVIFSFLIAGHISMALKHHYKDKDNTLMKIS